MNSKEKLAQALSEYKRKEEKENPDSKLTKEGVNRTRTLNKMIQDAIDGYYSDYDSPLATPCIQLVKDLDALGLTELSAKAKDGEFDATKEESNAWYEREGRQLALEVTGGNEEIADALFGKTKEQIESKEGIKGWDI